jgi:AcrR family transcriptional regulator
MRAMARWQPDARGRLEAAAMALYLERGFDDTTVVDIAARAGLTERTFFRYFADKREVLFSGAGALRDFLVDQVARASPTLAPLDAVAGALAATAPLFEARRDFARKRQTLIATHPELHERELIKLASLGSAIREALRDHGVPAPAASLAAEAGIAIFKSAFERWLDDGRKRDLAHHLRASLAELRTVTSGAAARQPPADAPRQAPGATRRQRRRR